MQIGMRSPEPLKPLFWWGFGRSACLRMTGSDTCLNGYGSVLWAWWHRGCAPNRWRGNGEQGQAG